MREMEAWWPSGVGSAGAGVKPPGAALAEDRRGERSGKRLGLTRSGGDQEDVTESARALFWVERALLRRRKGLDGIKIGGPASSSETSLAGSRVLGQAVPGVEAA